MAVPWCGGVSPQTLAPGRSRTIDNSMRRRGNSEKMRLSKEQHEAVAMAKNCVDTTRTGWSEYHVQFSKSRGNGGTISVAHRVFEN